MAVLLQLSLCVLTVIQLTSSQSTYDVIQQENDVNSCGRTEQMFSQLMTAVTLMGSKVSQIQKDVSQMQTTALQMQATISQLQSDVDKLKSFNQQQAVKGMLKSRRI